MQIEVTEDDIWRGRYDWPKSMFTCPVALAMERVLGKRVSVSGTYWLFESRIPDDALRRLPPEVTTFVYDVDNHRSVKPFTFELDYKP